MKAKFLALLVLVATHSLSWADCYYNGQRHGEGTRIGGYTCSGGQWR